jgi:hypothetical protein
MASPILLFNTVRHLRPIQVVNRATRWVMPLRRIPSVGEAGPMERRTPSLPARLGAGGFDGKSFEWLNRRHAFEGDDRWNPAGAERLWVYNLHYFQFLHGLDGRTGLGLIRDWIGKNDSAGGPGWEPYPLSMRIREWVEWLQSQDGVDPDERKAIESSIAAQAAALAAQLEYHLLGNHLLENAITLCWAGLSLNRAEAKAWLAQGLQILGEQLTAQLLADGTHEERSPMYQALLVEALLRLAEVARQAPGATAQEVVSLSEGAASALFASLGLLVHPDGDYALLNDCALGIAPTFADLGLRFPDHRPAAGVPGTNPWRLSSSGYRGWRIETGGYMVLDAGPVGPDHQPGHGHADTLSFEISHLGRRLIADTGVYTYETGNVRSYDRGTSAHNTIQVDTLEQAELWSAFRCGRRPRILEANRQTDLDVPECGGAYLAPAGLSSWYQHGRRVRRDAQVMRLQDDVEYPGQHVATLRLHLVPGVRLRAEGQGWAVLDGVDRVASISGERFEWSEGRSPYHPQFGMEMERACLVARIPFQDRLRASWKIVLH